MQVLATRLKDRQMREAQAREAAQRKSLIGSGDRSERIRTYNFPQGRVTDHRINLTRSEEHTSELQSRENIVCRLLLEKKNDLLCVGGVVMARPRGVIACSQSPRVLNLREQRVVVGKRRRARVRDRGEGVDPDVIHPDL